MKTRPRPIYNAPDEAVLERIDVNVIRVILEVGFVIDSMCPETRLPKGVGGAAGTARPMRGGRIGTLA